MGRRVHARPTVTCRVNDVNDSAEVSKGNRRRARRGMHGGNEYSAL